MLPFLYPIISSIIIYHILLLLWSIMAISMSYFHIFPIISIDGNHHWWKPPFLFRISYYIYATISISHNIIYHILLLLWSIMAISMSYFHIFPIISIDGNHHWWKPPFLFHIYVIFISYLYHIMLRFSDFPWSINHPAGVPPLKPRLLTASLVASSGSTELAVPLLHTAPDRRRVQDVPLVARPKKKGSGDSGGC